MTKNHRFTMYQNIIYDEGQIINPFECMKLLNYFYDENIDLVKMNEQLREENKELKELVSEVDNELEIRDIVCGAGKFRLEEWGKHRYHQFYKGDEELEDESIVIMLMELEKENKELKARCEEYRKLSVQYKQKYDEKISDNTFLEEENKELQKENEQLKSIKKFADRNGICIFNIDKAFRKCWQDNAKLVKENEQLKFQNSNLMKEVAEYSRKVKELEKVI